MMGAIERILLLRTMAIVIQLCAVIGFFVVMPQDIMIFPLLSIIALETVFHLFSWHRYRHHQASSFTVAVQAIADI
ncbi:MAG: sensor histidine kinase, partial [Psychrobium sp.]